LDVLLSRLLMLLALTLMIALALVTNAVQGQDPPNLLLLVLGCLYSEQDISFNGSGCFDAVE
jgi:hypothetical protein